MSWNIIGHEWAIDLLRRSIEGGHVAHAYLLSGPANVGKSLLALRIAQALNCEVGGPDPCLACRACKRIERGNHPDVRVAGMASQAAGLKPDEAQRQKELKIDTVREWQADINLRPYEGRRRVFILPVENVMQKDQRPLRKHFLEENSTIHTAQLHDHRLNQLKINYRAAF